MYVIFLKTVGFRCFYVFMKLFTMQNVYIDIWCIERAGRKNFPQDMC